MELLLVAAAVAVAVLWAALRVRRTVRAASRGAPACPGCASCDQASAPCDPAARAPTEGGSRHRAPPRHG